MKFIDNCWVKRFICPIYKTTYVLVLSEDIHNSRSLYERETGAEYKKEGAKAFTVEITGKGISGLTVLIILPLDCTAALGAHEIKHAVNMTFNHVGMKLDALNDEHECYYLQWLTQQVYEGVYKANILTDKEKEDNEREQRKSPHKPKK